MNHRTFFRKAFVAILLTASIGSAAPKTHLGIPSGDLVVLWASCHSSASSCPPLIRRLPDGSSEPSPFSVPEGKILVLTEIDWDYLNSSASAAALDQERAVLQIGVDSLVDPEQGGPMAYSASTIRFKDCVMSCQPHAFAFQNLSLTSGFAVSSQGILKYGLSIPVAGSGPGSVLTLFVRGYLISDKQK